MTSPTTLALIGVFCVLVVINLVGNTLVLMVVLGNRSMRTPMNYLLVNLSIADIMVAVSVAIQYIFGPAYEHPSGERGDYLCRFLTGVNFTWVGTAASVFCLVVIAAERHYVIVDQKQESRLTGSGLSIMVSCCWIFAFLLNVPMFSYLEYKNQAGEIKCSENWPINDIAKPYTAACLLLFGVIPTAVMIVLYSRVVSTLRARPVRATGPSEVAIIAKRRKVIRMVISVSVMYVLCRFPDLVLFLLTYYLPIPNVTASTTYVVCVLLVCLNSTMNPFLYSLHSTKFRKHLARLVCWRKRSGYQLLDSTSESTAVESVTSSLVQS